MIIIQFLQILGPLYILGRDEAVEFNFCPQVDDCKYLCS